jgi:hypothetical protein
MLQRDANNEAKQLQARGKVEGDIKMEVGGGGWRWRVRARVDDERGG